MAASGWQAFKFAALVFAVAASALAAVNWGGYADQETKRAVAAASFVVFSALTAVLCLRAARLRSPGRRMPWWLLAGAASCWTVGNCLWFYYQVLVPERQTYPGPADVFYVVSVPVAVAAMLTLPSRPLAGAARARAVVDGLIVAASLLFVSWILVVGPLVAQLGNASWVYLAVYLYYPLVDIALIAMSIGLAVRATGRDRVPMLLVAGAFVAIAFADTGIGYLALQGKEAAGSGLDLGWTFGYMMLALSALAPVGQDPSDERGDPRALFREFLPYLPVGVLVVLAGVDPSLLNDPVLARILLTVLALIIVRHMLTLADNIQLTGHLEQLVRRRTDDLEQLTRRHQSILDGAGEGIVGLDAAGAVTFVNPAATGLLGRSVGELAGRSFHEATQYRDAEGNAVSGLAHPLAVSLADGQVHAVTDGTYRRADGTAFAVEFTVAPVKGDNETGTGVVVIFRDVTERRAVERIKDEFISVISHELRTPLTSVRGALGLLHGPLLPDPPPKAQRMLDIAMDSTDRLIRLINDILDVERLAAGKLALKRQIWPAANFVRRAVAEMSGLAAEAGVEVEVGSIGGVVDADADRIVQTLVNLLSNAIKFSPAGGTVRVSTDARGREVVFGVIDEGPGIPPNALEEIFERFTQVDASDTRLKEGSGLGLAICRGIVEQHGGRIWASNEPSSGAAMFFALPQVNESVVLETLPDGDATRPVVLVCEGEDSARAAISQALPTHGYSVVAAVSGEQLLTMAIERNPAAVLVDLAMPGDDGWTAIGHLRANERTREVPILVLNGTGPGGGSPVDVAAWLAEPLDVEALLATLDQVVSGAGVDISVLVVEEDPTLASVLVSLLEGHGVVAVHANSAREALRLSSTAAPRLVLLDPLLPDEDGFALVDWLRQEPRLCRLPLVVYSALELDENDKQRLRLGPTEFFTKSKTHPEEVQRRVLELVDTVVIGATR